MNRSSKAPLSEFEMASLRQLAIDPGHYVLLAHRDLFVGMKLVELDGRRAVVTGLGLLRLQKAQAALWPKPPIGSFFRTPSRA